MAVRFSPPGEGAESPAPERANLAEVVDLRARLARRADAPSSEARAHGGDARESIAPVTRLETSSAGLSRAESEVTASVRAGDSSARGSASEDGVRLLARKACSSGELRRALLRLGHDAREVDAAVLEFESSLYLDDLGLARVLVEKLRERKLAGRAHLRVKLQERLLPDGVIDEVLGELDDGEELSLLRAAAEGRAVRLAGLDRQTAERRLFAYLARRGWSGEAVVRAARDALDGVAARQ